MRIEFIIPFVFGVFLGLVGVALLFDAWTPDELVVPRERRRRPRAERDRMGEGLIGLGIIGVGAAFMGRDVWSYRIVAMALGAILILVGAIRNRHLLGELISNRGRLRRGAPAEVLERSNGEASAAQPPDATESPERLRIR